jgi:hypothetical protein
VGPKTFVNPLVYVGMKVDRAQHHLDALDRELRRFDRKPSYTISRNEDVKNSLYIVRIEGKAAPQIIPMLLGDFICCLRSALDQLAWQLISIGPGGFKKRDEGKIYFPIIAKPENWPPWSLPFFPKESHSLLDKVQPYHRGAAFDKHPLWQLNELCNLDKHRVIPVNCSSLTVHFPVPGWEAFRRDLDYGLEVRFPLSMKSKFHLKPHVSSQILFGEHMGSLEISRNELGKINEFVRGEVIRPFSGLFSKFIGVK